MLGNTLVADGSGGLAGYLGSAGGERYALRVRSSDQRLSLEAGPQLQAVLRGHESMDLVWSFAPQAERHYLVKVPCLISAAPDDAGDTGSSHELVKQTLSVSGVGSKGAIKAEPELLEYGTGMCLAISHS